MLKPSPLSYVIVSPARNEAKFIDLTLSSVVAQTELPIKWIVVSDGSTDGTDEIVNRYAEKHSFIELLRLPERRERDFAGKVYAFRAGYERVKQLDHNVLVSLDADISFEPDYFEFLLGKLAGNPALGLVGTPFQELSGQVYDYKFVSIEHVSGACQVFRRECFEAIGGYVPIKGGSIDHVAVISARMRGWQTRTFLEKVCTHHREIGTAQQGTLKSKFKVGVKDYRIGNHPLWEAFRVAYQMTRTPRTVGGVALGIGYTWAAVRRLERPVPRELVQFHRKEQLDRLKRKLGLRGAGAPRRASSTAKAEVPQSLK
jgi:glycosyltransferase involved in cell wall biosynthesis